MNNCCLVILRHAQNFIKYFNVFNELLFMVLNIKVKYFIFSTNGKNEGVGKLGIAVLKDVAKRDVSLI